MFYFEKVYKNLSNCEHYNWQHYDGLLILVCKYNGKQYKIGAVISTKNRYPVPCYRQVCTLKGIKKVPIKCSGKKLVVKHNKKNFYRVDIDTNNNSRFLKKIICQHHFVSSIFRIIFCTALWCYLKKNLAPIFFYQFDILNVS